VGESLTFSAGRAELHRAAGREIIAAAAALGLAGGRLGPGPSGWSGLCPLGRRGKAQIGRSGLIGPLQRIRLEMEGRLLMPSEQPQIRIPTLNLGDELGPRFLRLQSRQAALAGTKAEKHHLVVLAGLELEGPAIGPIGKNRPPKLPQRQRLADPARSKGRQFANQLLEDALQISHRKSREKYRLDFRAPKPDASPGHTKPSWCVYWLLEALLRFVLEGLIAYWKAAGHAGGNRPGEITRAGIGERLQECHNVSDLGVAQGED
jgi:hypothetical protein